MARARSLLWLLPLVMLASCKTPFDKTWDTTAPPMTLNPADPLAGKWEGTWQSDATDYSGHLQAIIVPVPNGHGMKEGHEIQQYTASFKMRLFEVGFGDFAEYTVNLTATKGPDGRYHFEGKKDRGFHWGGIFRYDGYIDIEKDLFYCDYDSDRDVGTYKMRRLTLENQ